MGIIKVNQSDGRTQALEAVEGWRVMEVIRAHGLPIEAICGGACACATCHVHVAPEWAGRLHPARDDEEAMLDTLPATEPDLAPLLPDHLGRASRRPGSDARREPEP